MSFSFAAGAAVLLALSGAVELSARDVNSEAQQHFELAGQAQQSGNLEIAAREYLAGLRLRSDIPEVYGNLGLVYYLQSKFEDSSAAFEKAVALKPALRGADLFLGMDYVKLYEARRAIPHLRKAVESEPANKEARSWLCSALWDSGEETAAIQQLRQAVHDFPGDADFLFLLGEAYRKAANAEMEKAIRITPPASPFYHQIFGDIYREQRDWDKAIAHYRRALGIDRRWPDAHYGLAMVYFQQNRLTDARAELLLELQVNPAFTGAKAMLARNASPRNESEPLAVETTAQLAEASLLSRLAADPKNAKDRYQLAKAYHNLCLSVLEQLLASHPDSFRVHQLEAQTYADREENDKALAEYRIVEQTRPALPDLHFAIGHLLWKNHDSGEALEELRRELRLNPDHAEANAEIGTILVSEHQPDEAIPYLRKALRLKPDLIVVHRQLGKASYQRKEFAEAARELTEALPADHNGDIHYELGMVYKAMGRADEARTELEASRRIKAEQLDTVKIEKAEAVDR